MDPFIGEIRLFGGNFAPRNWAFCQGQFLPISENPQLFSIIGTKYGARGQTEFALPDFRGRAPLGFGKHPGSAYDWPMGGAGGEAYQTLTMSQMPQHSHTAALSGITARLNASGDAATAKGPNNKYLAESVGSNTYLNNANNPTNLHSGSITVESSGFSVDANLGNAGSGDVFSITQPIIGANYIIALVGIHPQRG